MDLLDAVKNDLGITHNKKDGDIEEAINAASVDLNIAGVAVKTDDSLVRQTIKLFCRAWYNYQGLSERWQAAYEALKIALALSGHHREGDSSEKQ